MKATLNKHRLNNLLRGIQTSINVFRGEGHERIYFAAQFTRGGRRQNGIERGDIGSFSKQLRTYIASEEADAARIEFINEETGKVIYSKALTDLRIAEPAAPAAQSHQPTQGLAGFMGLGEVQVAELIDKRVSEARRHDEFQRQQKEIADLQAKNGRLSEANSELEAKVKAKSELEFYTGLIGSAFPGLAALLSSTPLAPAANFLAGTGPVADAASEEKEENRSLATMVNEFCLTLSPQEVATTHLLFMAFEANRSKLQTALQLVTAGESRMAA